MSCELQRTGTPSACNFLCAQRAENFQKFCNCFARFWRNICVISTPNASFFGMERVVDSVNFSDVSLIMRNAFAGCTQVLRARRTGFPEILQFLRASLTQKLRDIDARRALLRIWTHCRLGEELQRRSSVHAAHAVRFQAIYLRAAR